MGIPQIVQNPSEALALQIPAKVFIGGIEVDVTKLEKKTLRYTTTKRPVEAGLDITDNRYKEPILLRLEGTMTDTPIGLDAIAATTISATLLGGPGFELVTWRDKKDALEALADSNEIIDIVGRLDSYESMNLNMVDVAETPNSAGSYPFVIEAETIRQVSSEVVSVDPSQIPKSLRDQETTDQKDARGKASKGAKKGAKQTKDAADKDVDPLRSLAQGLGFGV